MYKVYIKKLLLLSALCYAACAGAASELYVEGRDYVKLPSSIRDKQDIQQLLVSDPNKVQVLFFFSYGCHGCDVLHGPFSAWTKAQQLKPNSKVAVYYFPVSFNAQWKMLAKLYYVAEALDPSGKINEKIFVGLHKEGLKLWQESAMQNFLVKEGYSEQEFKKAYKSFSIFQKVKRADELSLSYNITVTPDIVVNGPIASYKVELAKVGNSVPKLLAVLNYLVERETKMLANDNVKPQKN